MMKELFQAVWSLPFLVLLACVPAYYSFNFNKEYDLLRPLSEQYFDKWDRGESSFQGMADCFTENLSAAFGRGNLFFTAACLTLGGVGSLLWMAVASGVCLLMRFLRVMALFYADEGERSGPGSCLNSGQGADTSSGLAGFFRHVIGGQMHFRHAVVLSGLWGATGVLVGLLSPSNYFTARAICGDENSLLFVSAAFALLGAGLFFAGRSRDGGGTSLGGIGFRLKRYLPWAYAVFLSVLLLKNWSLIFMAVAAVATDGLQIHMFVGPMMGKGWGLTLTCGVCLCCWHSGLLHDCGDRRYCRCAEQTGASAAEAGFWAMLEGLAGIVVSGALGGLLVVMCAISQPAEGMGRIIAMVRYLSGGFPPLAILFFCLSVWFGWCSCREELDIFREGLGDFSKKGKSGRPFPAAVYPVFGLVAALTAAYWDRGVGFAQLSWPCFLLTLLFFSVTLQVIAALSVSEKMASEIKIYQIRSWKKGIS